MALQSVNPADDTLLSEYPEMTSGEVTGIIDEVHRAWLDWRTLSYAERGVYLHRAADMLEARKHEYAELITREMGKTLGQSIAEIEKCAFGCRYFADHAAELLAPLPVASDATKSFVTCQPLGVLLAIMPWNFPFWQVFRCAFQALMAGNAVVLKHANNVTGSALAVEACLREAGLPDNLFRTLVIDIPEVEAVIQHDKVRIITLTGSPRAGRAVATTAAAVLKKCIFELGGSDAFVVLEDADIEAAADTAVTSRLICAGQSCIAAKRFIVVESVRKAFEEKFIEKMAAQTLGDPMEPLTTVGPLARLDLRDGLHRQVERSIAAGATCVLGGEIPNRKGAWYPPTVLTGVMKGMPAFDEELFGPVGALIAARDEAHAIQLANDSIYGLGAVVFTQDVMRGERIAATQLEAGCCFVNALVKSDPRLPFGGVKDSGYGRELGAHGIQDLCNIKTVYVK